MLEEEPHLKNVIMKCREAHILEMSMIKEAYYTYLSQGQEGLDAIEYPPLKSPIDELNELYVELESNEFSDKLKFVLFYKSKAFSFVLFVIDMCIAFIPIVK